MQEKQKYLLLGLIIVMALFTFIEYSWPYNFTKDDNFAQFLPSLLHGEEQVFSGQFPSINYNQYLGVRLFEVGTHAIFYPPMILSYFFAHYLFRNDFILLEIFSFLHLILGFSITYFFISDKTKNYLTGLLSGIAWTFSGYVLIAGANWYYVFPTLFFLPLLLLVNDRMREKSYIKIIFLSGIIKGLYFYSGNAQYFFYTLLFEFLYGLYNEYQSENELLTYLEKYFLSTIICLIIIFPLLFAQYTLASESERGNTSFVGYIFSLGAQPAELLLGILFPSPLVESNNPFSYAPSTFSHIYYAGSLFSIFFIFGWIYGIRKYHWKVFNSIPAPYLLAVLAAWLSIGLYGGLYEIGAFLPITKNFSNPFKLTLFTNFFIIFAGSILLARIIEKYKEKVHYKKILFASLIIFSILMTYHVYVCSSIAWSYYGDEVPLDKHPLQTIYQNDQGRVVSLFTNSSFDPRQIKNHFSENHLIHAPFLTQNFASYYHVQYLSGYEPFVDKLTSEKIPINRFGLVNVELNISALRAYGVKYIITPSADTLQPGLQNLSLIYEDEVMKILKVEGSDPLIFSSAREIKYSEVGSKIEFITNFTNDTQVVINYLYKPEYRARSDINLEIKSDELGRMKILMPKGVHKVEFYYFPKNLIFGLIISCILLIVTLVYISRRKELISFLSSKRFHISKKQVVFLFLILFFAFVCMIFTKITSQETISEVIAERTNIDFSFTDLKINLFRMQISINNFSVSTPKGNAVKNGNINAHFSLIGSVSETIKSKRLSLFFDKIDISDLEISGAIDNQINVCENYLEIYESSTLHQNSTYVLDVGKIESKILFLPLNEAFLEFRGRGMVNSNESIEIFGNLAIKKYISGNISVIGNEKIEKRKYCVILPREKPNNIFY